jgi:hypothetical protein
MAPAAPPATPPATSRRGALFGLTLGLVLQRVLCPAAPAAAEDVAPEILGSWRVDAEVARAEVLRTLEDELMALPEEDRAALRETVLAELERTLREIGQGIELRPDGTAVLSTADGPVAATWTPDEDYLRIERRDPGPDDVAMLAFLEDGTLWIEPDDLTADALPIPLTRR